jgi:hypothetical protein
MREIKSTNVKMSVIDDFYKSNEVGDWFISLTPRINAEILKTVFEVVKELKRRQTMREAMVNER